MIHGYINIIVLVSLLHFGYSDAGEYCSSDSGNYKYCENDCCDNDCCGYSTMAIVGAVIGGVFFLAMLISCVVCIYCMCKKNSRQGSVVQPYQNTNTVYVHNTPYGNMPPRANPPSYSQASAYPSYSSQFDPAYPPGAVDHPPPAYTYSNPNSNAK